MPRAGWCRECGEWVWVDPEGACRNGHGPDCVESVHEQPDPAPAPLEPPSAEQDGRGRTDLAAGGRPFGVGEMPASLQRFGWGAFALTPLWGGVYGVWPVISLWLLLLLTPIVAASFVPADAGQATLSFATVISQVVGSALRLWIGMNALRWLWKREAFRLEALPDAQPRFTIERFLARQRTWAVFAGLYLVFGLLGLATMASSQDPAILSAMKQFGLTSELAWLSLGWTLAEISLAVWLDSQMRKGTRAEPAQEQ